MAKPKTIPPEVARAMTTVEAAEGVTKGAKADLKTANDAVATAKGIAEEKDATDAHRAALAEAVGVAEIAAGLVEDAEAAEKTAGGILAAAKASVANKPKHVIADGHSITVGTRILGPGDPVSAAVLTDGDKALKGFIKSGHIRKND